MTQSCEEIQVNHHINDFRCTKQRGHSGAHVDPVTQTQWNHRHARYPVRPPLSTVGDGSLFRTTHCSRCCKNPTGSVHFHKPGQSCGGDFGVPLIGSKQVECPRCNTVYLAPACRPIDQN